MAGLFQNLLSQVQNFGQRQQQLNMFGRPRGTGLFGLQGQAPSPSPGAQRLPLAGTRALLPPGLTPYVPPSPSEIPLGTTRMEQLTQAPRGTPEGVPGIPVGSGPFDTSSGLGAGLPFQTIGDGAVSPATIQAMTGNNALPRAVPSQQPTRLTPEQQFALFTGGQSPNFDLAAITGTDNRINPRQTPIANAVLGQFGLAGTGIDPNNFFNMGRLDLNRFNPRALAQMSARDRQRMIDANVLGADLLSAPTKPAPQSDLSFWKGHRVRRQRPATRLI